MTGCLPSAARCVVGRGFGMPEGEPIPVMRGINGPNRRRFRLTQDLNPTPRTEIAWSAALAGAIIFQQRATGNASLVGGPPRL